MPTEAPTTEREPILRPGEIIDGRYTIVQTLAEGGMSTVFLAEHLLIKRRVALKVLHSELVADRAMVKRFMNEATAAGMLGHPNIVESTDMGFTEGRIPYIVFEYLEGALLTEEIYRVGGLPVRRALRIASQIASALEAAHQAHIIHLDLKSDNIILTDKDGVADHVKVLDFGISKFMELDADKTQRAIIMGTPQFMAPEQVSAPELIDHRADIYALGVVLYEMLTARRPFANTDPRIILYRLVHEPAPPLERADIPADLEALIFHRLLAKDRDHRFQSMRDVQLALDAISESLRSAESARLAASAPAPAADDAPYADLSFEGPIATSRRRRPRFGFLIAALVAGAAGGALAYSMTRVVDSTDDAAIASLHADAAKIGASLADALRATHARAAGIATAPMTRAAIETDRATVADLIADGQLPIKAAAGEVIEVFQLQGKTAASLLRMPATGAAIAPALGDTMRLASDGTRLTMVVSAAVTKQTSAVGGAVAIAAPVDLDLAHTLVAEDAIEARLVGLGAPIRLAGPDAPVAGGPSITVPISFPADVDGGGLALAATIRHVTGGSTLRTARNGSLACSGGLLVLFAASGLVRRRSSRVV